MKYFNLFEDKKQDKVNKYGCLMLSINAKEIQLKEIHKLISKKHLYESEIVDEYGLEKKPHVTVLFGFHDTDTKAYADKILTSDSLKETTISIKNCSIFSSDEYDVVKLSVKSKNLMEMNREYSKKFKYTCEFDYHPHLTIAYVKKGNGKALAKQIQKKLEELDLIGREIVSKTFIYSRPSGERIKKTVK